MAVEKNNLGADFPTWRRRFCHRAVMLLLLLLDASIVNATISSALDTAFVHRNTRGRPRPSRSLSAGYIASWPSAGRRRCKIPLCATTSPEDDLVQWATTTYKDDDDKNNKHDANHPNVAIAPSTIAGGGHGLFVQRSFDAGEVLFVVPADKCPSTAIAIKSDPALALLAADGGPGGQKAAVVGWLASQLAKNYGHDASSPSSFWKPYLDLLPWQPGAQDHFLWWSDDDIMDKLDECRYVDDILSLRRGVEYAVEILMDLLSEDRSVTEDMITGAFVCLYSRAFEDKADCSKLVPLLDMAQHATVPRDSNIHHVSDTTGNVVVTAKRDVSAGQELFIPYMMDGFDPGRFAMFYGFVPGESKSLQQLVDEKSPVFF